MNLTRSLLGVFEKVSQPPNCHSNFFGVTYIYMERKGMVYIRIRHTYKFTQHQSHKPLLAHALSG